MNSRRTIEILATFFYLGRAPLMPGTVGTIGAIPLVVLFSLAGVYGYIGLTFIFTLWSIRVADQYEQIVQDHDTKEVVIDEVAGYLIAMFWLPHTWQAFLASFILFRTLDILKPYPISALDARAQGGFGTVVDDIVAGVIANIALQFVYTQTNWLGMKYVFGS
ncbi:MAG: phosphatidylglycerophosphatase [Bdellovibrionales bacterium RBG_16_40_8]|nr:MAG: phosphatidylglycerophosphatase [Bdellovibrionales bacterium RBG_16_40_8]